jgi:hypothetical protein
MLWDIPLNPVSAGRVLIFIAIYYRKRQAAQAASREMATWSQTPLMETSTLLPFLTT